MQTLRECRIRNGVDQATVADYLGVSCQAYAWYEQHPEDLSIEQALILCDFLRFDFDLLCA